ncbi:CLUMA_CG002319, isoform A [Clunio marinus]|uniref:CLUMA_CG002319, isoform A n=1 Tax=Clunio marinus TaxID=568069 RepID=A0A1J1HLX5_9DIPT|nr:CLUMA_CG002319, isoform A [Clunio marinus]
MTRENVIVRENNKKNDMDNILSNLNSPTSNLHRWLLGLPARCFPIFTKHVKLTSAIYECLGINIMRITLNIVYVYPVLIIDLLKTFPPSLSVGIEACKAFQALFIIDESYNKWILVSLPLSALCLKKSRFS